MSYVRNEDDLTSATRVAPSPAAVAERAPAAPPVAGLNRTWDARAGMREVESLLAQLDPSIRFDADYPEPIRYDTTRKVLRYRGPMSHASFVVLRALSDDRQYQLAMERLFVATSIPAAKPRSLIPWMGGGAAAVVVLAAGGFGLSRLGHQDAQPPKPATQAVTAHEDAATVPSMPVNTSVLDSAEAQRK